MPTQEFIRAICGAGTAAVDCSFCGTTSVAGGNDYWHDDDEGANEFAALKEKAKTSKNILIRDCDFISFGDMGGKTFVEGCCDDEWDRYETFIVQNQDTIVTFLKARAVRLNNEAEQNASLLADA